MTVSHIHWKRSLRHGAWKIIGVLVGFMLLGFILPDKLAWQISYVVAFAATGIFIIVHNRKNPIAPCSSCHSELLEIIMAAKRSNQVPRFCPLCGNPIEV